MRAQLDFQMRSKFLCHLLNKISALALAGDAVPIEPVSGQIPC
jgi:hypothetical protein